MTGWQFLGLYILYIIFLFVIYRFIKNRLKLKAERRRAAAQARQCVEYLKSQDICSNSKENKNV